LVEIAARAHFGGKPAAIAIDDTALARRIAIITETVAEQPSSCNRIGVVAVSILLFAVTVPTSRAIHRTTLQFPLTSRDGGSIRAVNASPLSILRPAGDLPVVLLPLQRAPDVRDCYVQSLATQNDLRVDAPLALVIESSGGVQAATAAIPNAPRLRECIETAALGWHLPLPWLDRPQGEWLDAHYPIAAHARRSQVS
jgi:hypothetical protein